MPLALSGAFALTYLATVGHTKYAVRCFQREVPEGQLRYDAISRALTALASPYFVNFKYQPQGIRINNELFPLVRMDWVDGQSLSSFLDNSFGNGAKIRTLRDTFQSMARYLSSKGIAHGDIQNLNVMVANGQLKLIDYDGMFVPGMTAGRGAEIGVKYFQHPTREPKHFGPAMDRFSFISIDISLRALLEEPRLYPQYREGGETILFKANDYADPYNSEIFRRLLQKPSLKVPAEHFAAI